MIGETSTWVVALYAGILLLAIAALWALVEWRAALSISALIYLAFEAGKLGARWYDEKKRT